jgi:hypothetical protein
VSSDSAVDAGATAAEERLAWRCITEVKKFDGDSTDDDDLVETLVIEGNAVAAAGVSALWEYGLGNGTTTAGQSLTYITSTNAAIGVGDSTTANATPCIFTDLQASTNKTRVVMDATYPQHSPGSSATAMTITFRATYGTSVANYAWNEWAVFNSATAGAGSMFNRAVVALGTKTSTATWQLTVTITIS